MIALVEGAVRQKTPNEIALNILIAGLTMIFLLAVATLPPYAKYAIKSAGSGRSAECGRLVSLLVCLIPTTIGGAAFRNRHRRHGSRDAAQRARNERQSRRASGDVNTLLLDKTGTITLGNRQAVEFITVNDARESELADAAQLSSLADETLKAVPSSFLRRRNTACAAAKCGT